MDALDGNAIAGMLFDHFGREMTTARGECMVCSARAEIAELVVFMTGPGAVVRCRSCGRVVIVAVEIRGTTRVDLAGFRLAEG